MLATLLQHADQYVSTDRLFESVWPNPPASAHANLRTQVTALRRAPRRLLRPARRKAHHPPRRPGDHAAYRLAAAPDEIDAAVFTTLTDRGHEQLVTDRPGKAVQTSAPRWRSGAAPSASTSPTPPPSAPGRPS